MANVYWKQEKKKGLSQEELANSINTKAPVIGRYERDEMKPSIEAAAKIADMLEVSLDWLVGNTDAELNKKNIKRLLDIEKLPEHDQLNIFYTLDNLIKAAKISMM